ncbi:MAG: ribonuclease HI [Parcubacteria group bacterium Gr01-1014_20]|nr:MAG: ribonuclease HI [Parcubacteria group bacterium Gr01-1014_20]
MVKKSQKLFGEGGDGGKLVIYTDGGARGNPGPAALGVVVGDKEYSEYLGEMTNNKAEYLALVFALKKAKALLGGKRAGEAELEVRMDSELIVRQLNGIYKIKEPDLQPLFIEVWNSRLDFGKVIFKHIPREQNKRADRLVNSELDSI